ncbi:MAG: hypothetical protein R3B49_05005 [Phycisphaerales bacterium]
MNTRLAALVCLAALAPLASADLTSRDWAASGDGLLTFDADSGLEWLDWEYTNNRSYADVSSQLGAGGEFEGFRYATEDEMRGLYEHAGAVYIDPVDGGDSGNIPANELLADLLGPTFPAGSRPSTTCPGRRRTSSPRSEPRSGRALTFTWSARSTSGSGQIAMRWLNLDDAVPVGFAGHALVRTGGPACACDLDGNTTLNLDDIAAFASGFVAGDLAVDLDGNGVLNLDDIAFFADCFITGCP